MKRRILGLFRQPWAADPALARPSAYNPVKMYHWALQYKANPRDDAYLRALFQERFPAGDFLDCDQNKEWRTAAAQADEVVLLYPDAIGLGFGRLEREVRRLRQPWAGLSVLNGRRRYFRLNAATLIGLRLRRALERSMAGEVLAVLLFCLVTPFLLAKDYFGGRR